MMIIGITAGTILFTYTLILLFTISCRYNPKVNNFTDLASLVTREYHSGDPHTQMYALRLSEAKVTQR